MAITTQDQLVNAIANGRTVQFFKSSISTTSGGWSTLFRAGGMPGAGAVPTTAAGNTLSRTSVGAMPIPAPSGTSYITSYEGVSNVSGTYILADRLVETATLSGTVTTAQTVNTVALPARATGATDVELWLEIYTATGATPSATVTASYTNQSGVSGHTATLLGGLPASPLASRTFQMNLQAGDTGVMSVESVTSTTSTATAGNFGVVLRRSLLFGAVPVGNVGFSQGWAETDLQIVGDDSCIEVLDLANSAGSGSFQGNFGLAQG